MHCLEKKKKKWCNHYVTSLLNTLFWGSFCLMTVPPPKIIRQGWELVRNFSLFFHNFPLPTGTNSIFCLFVIIWRDWSGAQVIFLRPGAGCKNKTSFLGLHSAELLKAWELFSVHAWQSPGEVGAAPYFSLRVKYRIETSTQNLLFNTSLCIEGSSGQVLGCRITSEHFWGLLPCVSKLLSR